MDHKIRFKKIYIDNLILRKPKPSDYKELFLNYASDFDVAYFTTWTPHKNEQETKLFIKKIIELWNLNKEYNFIIAEKTQISQSVFLKSY